MLRRSISCMCAGLLIAVCMWLFICAGETGWMPNGGTVPVVAILVGIAGVIWLYDEISDYPAKPTAVEFPAEIDSRPEATPQRGHALDSRDSTQRLPGPPQG